MQCPFCQQPDSRVVDSRESAEGVRRRRECQRCGQRFTTMERLYTQALLVVKRDGRREEFSREKVRSGVLKACAKRPVSIESIEKLCDDVERELARLNRAEAPSSLIGQLVMEGLRALDHVAYVRFASVYRNFQSPESFAREVEALRGTDAAPNPRELQAQMPLPLNGNGANANGLGPRATRRVAGHKRPRKRESQGGP